MQEGGDARLDTSLETLLERAPRDGSARVLATVVATAGSTYRKPGARMLIMADGSYFGLLSGGCLEADLGLHAQAVLESGTPRALDYDMRGPDDVLFGLGAGCEGAMRVLLEPAGAASLCAASLENAGSLTRRGLAAHLVVVHQSSDTTLGTYDSTAALPADLRAAAERACTPGESCSIDFTIAGGRTRAFVQYLAPAPHVLICGAGPDAHPVVNGALSLGWRVSIVDHRPAFANAERFPGAHVARVDARRLRSAIDLTQCHAAVVMSHHLPSDVAYLAELADAQRPAYVGLLGPPARRLRIARELGPTAAALRSRLRSPIGLNIGAVTPEGIALAILSQIHSYLAKRPSALEPESDEWPDSPT